MYRLVSDVDELAAQLIFVCLHCLKQIWINRGGTTTAIKQRTKMR